MHHTPIIRQGATTLLSLAANAFLVFVMLFVSGGYAAEPKVPDFTKGEKLVQTTKEALRSRMLGPTGLWADYFCQGMDHGASLLTRQFLVLWEQR